MKIRQNTSVGTWNYPICWWRHLTIGLLGLAFLGVVAGLEGKKPIKPPPEPPPDYEGGVIYMRITSDWSYPPHWVCEMNADGTGLTELFICKDEDDTMEYSMITPSKNVYGGSRLFLCTKQQPVMLAQRWWDAEAGVMQVDVYENNLDTCLILVDETGVESDNLLLDNAIVVGNWSGPDLDWYADDTRIAFWGVGLMQATGQATGVLEYNWESMGIYTLDISIDDLTGTVTVGTPEFMEWTNDALTNWWDEDHHYAKVPSTNCFDVLVEPDGTETLYLTHWLEHPSLGWWDPALYVADLATGGLAWLRDEDFGSLQVNPSGTTVMGDEGGVIYQYDIATGSVNTLSHKRYRYGGGQWSPSGENILFGRRKLNNDFFGENVRATAEGEDITVIWEGGPQARGGYIAWRARP